MVTYFLSFKLKISNFYHRSSGFQYRNYAVAMFCLVIRFIDSLLFVMIRGYHTFYSYPSLDLFFKEVILTDAGTRQTCPVLLNQALMQFYRKITAMKSDEIFVKMSQILHPAVYSPSGAPSLKNVHR